MKAEEKKKSAKMGRPKKYTPQSMQAKIEQYFPHCKEQDEIPDVEGLCVYLEICRDTLLDYQRQPDFSDTIKKAKTKIFAEKKQLAMRGKMNSAVWIFDAKNNHGYVEKIENDLNIRNYESIAEKFRKAGTI